MTGLHTPLVLFDKMEASKKKGRCFYETDDYIKSGRGGCKNRSGGAAADGWLLPVQAGTDGGKPLYVSGVPRADGGPKL